MTHSKTPPARSGVRGPVGDTAPRSVTLAGGGLDGSRGPLTLQRQYCKLLAITVSAWAALGGVGFLCASAQETVMVGRQAEVELDAVRAEKARVILKVRLVAHHGGSKYHWQTVKPIRTLKNVSGKAFDKPFKVANYGWEPGVPQGISTIYLVPYGARTDTWRVLAADTGKGKERAGVDTLPKAAVLPAGGAQGVKGKVVKLTGNFMPTPDATPGGSRTPLAVPVHIFKGKVKTFQKPNPKHPQLVKIVNSGKDGDYRCVLPAGEYTVVAVIDGRLYLNAWSSDGKHRCWATVKVKAGEWTAWDIQDTSSAVF